MKILIVSFVFLLFAIPSYSQETIDPDSKTDHYLRKSKSQRTIGFILVGAGTGAIVIGAVVQANSHEFLDFTGAFIAVAGGIVDLASIPFFISAGHNSRKAASLSFKNSPLILPGQYNMALKAQPTLAFTITF